MLSALFKTRPLLATNEQAWILDTFAWAIENFDINVFKDESQLVLPNNEFYPGKVSSIHEMALAIFNNTVKYAGMQGWPIKLVAPEVYENKPMSQLALPQIFRGKHGQITEQSEQQFIYITYNPQQINQPQDMIASFAHALATILIVQSGEIPPGGQENLPQAAEVVACFMGFGVMFANTAYQFKGGCGSCFNASANRQAALPEKESVYILALFSVLKKIPIKSVRAHLKSHMRKTFTMAYKELNSSLKTATQPALLAVR